MPELFPWFLFLHVLAAIVAFGPTFAFPLIGAMGGAEPQHANFATRVSSRIGDRIVTPLALTLPVTGLGMIWARSIDLFATRWLLLAIVLYVVALSFSYFVQRPIVGRIIQMTSSPPPPPAEGAPAGPPPALRLAVRSVQRNGMILTLLIVTLVFLMVVKPTF